MNIYLASPFFNETEIEIYLQTISNLRSVGHKVYVPREHTIENGENMPNHIWGKEVFNEDIKGIDDCDTVVAINYGLYSDSGTAWEIGYAFGIGKQIINILCLTDETSLMTFNCGLNCFYEDIEDWSNLEQYCSATLPIQQT